MLVNPATQEAFHSFSNSSQRFPEENLRNGALLFYYKLLKEVTLVGQKCSKVPKQGEVMRRRIAANCSGECNFQANADDRSLCLLLGCSILKNDTREIWGVAKQIRRYSV